MKKVGPCDYHWGTCKAMFGTSALARTGPLKVHSRWYILPMLLRVAQSSGELCSGSFIVRTEIHRRPLRHSRLPYLIRRMRELARADQPAKWRGLGSRCLIGLDKLLLEVSTPNKPAAGFLG